MKKYLQLLIFNILMLAFPSAWAGLTIEITKGVTSTMPIAVVPFAWQPGTRKTVDIAGVIRADLQRSGFFKPLPVADMLTQPSQPEQIRFRNWQALGQDYLLIGQVMPSGLRYDVKFQLFDVYKGEQIMGYRLTVAANKLRKTAHRISDLVFEKLTGKPGVFSTHIAYVTSVRLKNGKKQYRLQVADADGYNAKIIASSYEPIMSPNWSPDGRKIAYVSFERRRSGIYIQDLASGKRQKIPSFKGINGAPAFSPDGRQLALTLSKDGSPDIYLFDLATRRFRKLTHSYAIDTEAAWSPDGRYIVFTSDRGGKPQIYQISSSGGRASRLTFTGSYNARARFSKDGRNLVMVHANGGDYRIAVMDMATRTINVLTTGPLDESPSFAPNGTMILYATRQAGRSILSAVSVDGKMHQNLGFTGGDVREPAWAP